MSALPMRFASVPVATHARSRAALAARWLTPDEEALCSRRAVEKRRAEFTAGRIAAKLALARLRGTSPLDAESWIGVADGYESGRPIVTDRAGRTLSNIALSITHSEGVAIAAAASTPLGIDLVPIADRGPGFTAEAFAPGELEAWRKCTPDEASAQSLAFGAKEAVLKWMGVGLRASLREVVVRPTRPGRRLKCPDLNSSALELGLKVSLSGRSSDGGSSLSLQCWLMRVADQLLVVAAGAVFNRRRIG